MFQKALQKSIQFVPWTLRSAIKRFFVVAALQRWILAKFLEGKPFIHTIDAGPAKGLTTVIELPDDKGIWTGTYEQDFVKFLAEAVEQEDVCFDVGGWHGFCGGIMALRGASRTVIFEPMPENCLRINKLIELNPVLKISLVEGAAGETDGKAVFHVVAADSMGKLENSVFNNDDKIGRSIEVDVFSLDNWCERNSVPFPNLIKIDVEGAELMVLKGSESILSVSRPRLFVEAHSRELTTQVTSFLLMRGYNVKCMQTNQLPDGVTEPAVCHIYACVQK